jgi:hypothetical protein
MPEGDTGREAILRERASAGGKARAAALSPAERTQIASGAAKARWGSVGDGAAEKEIKALGKVVSIIAELEPAARSRVFVYLSNLFEEYYDQSLHRGSGNKE